VKQCIERGGNDTTVCLTVTWTGIFVLEQLCVLMKPLLHS
jgi:hypothetical protein